MLNLAPLMRVPTYTFEVTLARKKTLNANQAARAKVAYVAAPNAGEAKRIAERRPENAAFKATQVRKAP